MPSSVRTAQSTEWPEGVIARYLTLGGATADVLDGTSPWRSGVGHNLSAACTGELCDWTSHGPEFWFEAGETSMDYVPYRDAVARLRADAQAHAEKCRAMLRPTA
jgi:hypothetical protein